MTGSGRLRHQRQKHAVPLDGLADLAKPSVLLSRRHRSCLPPGHYGPRIIVVEVERPLHRKMHTGGPRPDTCPPPPGTVPTPEAATIGVRHPELADERMSLSRATRSTM